MGLTKALGWTRDQTSGQGVGTGAQAVSQRYMQVVTHAPYLTGRQERLAGRVLRWSMHEEVGRQEGTKAGGDARSWDVLIIFEGNCPMMYIGTDG